MVCLPCYPFYLFPFRKSSRHMSIVTRLIVSIDRKLKQAAVKEITDIAIEFYKSHPDVVVGLELSGNPSVGKFCDFEPSLKRARDHGLKVGRKLLLVYYSALVCCHYKIGEMMMA